MTVVWRLIKSRFAASAFDGEGARQYGARWNSPGVPVAYASESPALATLEVLVHLKRSDTLSSYSLISADVSNDLIKELPMKQLPSNWKAVPIPQETQAIGDDWVRENRSVALQVPSAVISPGKVYLLNPAHPHFSRITRRPPQRFVFDARLIKHVT